MQNKLTNTVQRRRNGVNAFTLVACIAAVGFTSVSAQAYIAKETSITTQVDSYLLKSDKGAQRVYKQLANRAKQACRNGGRQTLLSRRMTDECAANLLNTFVLDLDNVRVTTFHQRVLSK